MGGKRFSIVVSHLVAIFTLTLFGTSTNAQTFTVLHSFDGTDGSQVFPGLVQASNGDFYGATADGGANSNKDCVDNCGTVFKLTATGKLTTLYSFCSQSGCSTGPSPKQRWSRTPMGTSTGQPSCWGPITVGRSSKSAPVAR